MYRVNEPDVFAIYDTQGRQFRNTLEQLQRIRKPQAGRRVSSRLDDAEQALQNLTEQAADRQVSLKARQAYREALQFNEREAIVHAYQLMSHPVETVQLTLDIVSAWQRFRERPHYQLPVLDKRQQVVGMLCERDLLRVMLAAAEDRIKSLRGKTVADAMSAEVITAAPITDIRRIARVMLEYRLSALPIVDERDALTGLVSRSDILRAAIHDPPLSLWT